jgi:ABC-2 type transport system permease protein
VFVSGIYMAIGISGEKQQRVTEVVVSAIRPQSWIDGKIAAYSLVGMLQAALWGASLGVFAGFLGLAVVPRLNPLLLAGVLAFASLGFVQYCALFALVLATVKDLQSTQKFQAYLFFVPMMPFLFAEGALRTPDATWVMALSHVPLFSPTLLPMRMLVGAVQPWEPPVALLVLLGSTLLLRRAAGEAFRIGMLMYGKELTLPELWRWARER